MAGFLALQLVLTARFGAPLRLMGHLVWPCLIFGLLRASYSHLVLSVRLSSHRTLYIYLPVSA